MPARRRRSCLKDMNRDDANFEDLRRAANRRRLVHLVLACTGLSTLLTVGVTREVSIHREVSAVAPASAGDLAGMERRHAELERLASRHHFWTGALRVRNHLSELTLAIAELERAVEARERDEQQALQRTREDAELERVRGLVAVERGQYSEALLHFKAALSTSDSAGEGGDSEEPWEHRDQLVTDIRALEQWEEERR